MQSRTLPGATQWAGSESGHSMLALAESPISSTNDLILALERRNPGDTVRLTLLRDKQRIEVDVILDEPR